MSDVTQAFKTFDDFVRHAMARFEVPGVAVGILHDRHEHTAGFGVTNVNHPLPVDGDTLFQIGSTSKTFTATLAMRLVELGVTTGQTPPLDLERPVRQYLPHFHLRDEDAAARVCLRDLLTHMGGWLGDYFDDTGAGDDALGEYVRRMAELPQLTPLGTIWSYNNAGFSLTGRVIEVVTGKTYEAALKEYVLDPLGLGRSFIMPTDAMTHRFVVGHRVGNGEPKVLTPWAIARSAHPAGGVVSTARDQLRYARFHLNAGEPKTGDGDPSTARVLSPRMIAAMQSPVASAALGERMGLSWFIGQRAGVRVVRHGGATLGHLSAFEMAPDCEFAVTVLTNATRGAELHREVTRFAAEHFLGVKEPECVHSPATPALLNEVAGRYSTAMADLDLTIDSSGLTMHTTPKGGFPTRYSPAPPAPPPSRFAFVGSDRIVALDGPVKDVQGEFLRDADGRIAWFRFGGRIRART
jgi:CubicO group peptidase (beta-lactamase class C family)